MLELGGNHAMATIPTATTQTQELTIIRLLGSIG
jgi:hypothetical protein